jgi:hypothetical protein
MALTRWANQCRGHRWVSGALASSVGPITFEVFGPWVRSFGQFNMMIQRLICYSALANQCLGRDGSRHKGIFSISLLHLIRLSSIFAHSRLEVAILWICLSEWEMIGKRCFVSCLYISAVQCPPVFLFERQIQTIFSCGLFPLTQVRNIPASSPLAVDFAVPSNAIFWPRHRWPEATQQPAFVLASSLMSVWCVRAFGSLHISILQFILYGLVKLLFTIEPFSRLNPKQLQLIKICNQGEGRG